MRLRSGAAPGSAVFATSVTPRLHPLGTGTIFVASMGIPYILEKYSPSAVRQNASGSRGSIQPYSKKWTSFGDPLPDNVVHPLSDQGVIKDGFQVACLPFIEGMRPEYRAGLSNGKAGWAVLDEALPLLITSVTRATPYQQNR